MPTNQPSGRLNQLLWRKERTTGWIARFKNAERLFPWIRLVVLLVDLLFVFLAFQMLPLANSWLVVFLALVGFATAAMLHNRLVWKISRLQAFENILAGQVARLELDWNNIPAPYTPKIPAEHQFAKDLYIIGDRSIHQLLDTCISSGGSRVLAKWLLATIPEITETELRQKQIKELIPKPGFRIRLEMNGVLASPNPMHYWDTSLISKWLEHRQQTSSLLPFLIVLAILAILNIVFFILNTTGVTPAYWLGTIVIYLGIQSVKFRETSELFEEAYQLGKQLKQLQGILSDVETYPYVKGSLLSNLTSSLTEKQNRPSRALRQVSRIITAASLRNNPFFALFLNLLIPWDLFFAYSLERYKIALRNKLPAWLETWYQLEALGSLANFASLHPEYTFPELAQAETRPVLKLTGAGHPLIPAQVRVNNNFEIKQLGEIILITGSNMSGKSTFLRMVGMNLVLAYAGSPVAAEKMHTMPFRIFTSMAINDSLSDGISYFYAEVHRLKALLDQLESGQSYPLLFLIDEIFRGTNNRERRLGSRAYTRALAGKNGVGFISTHDLDLVNLAKQNSFIANFHFKEEIKDDKMLFDYKIQTGASPTTNALRIMALAGLPVPIDEEQA